MLAIVKKTFCHFNHFPEAQQRTVAENWYGIRPRVQLEYLKYKETMEMRNTLFFWLEAEIHYCWI